MSEIAVLPKPAPAKVLPHETANRDWKVLVLSDRLEIRKALLRSFEGLPITAFTASTVEQAEEVLLSHSVAVVFCDEALADGTSYRALLEIVRARHKAARFVVILHAGEWTEYQQAMLLGATDVLRAPLQSIEVELVLIRAGRDCDRQGFDVLA